jgi:hypothetical protein
MTILIALSTLVVLPILVGVGYVIHDIVAERRHVSELDERLAARYRHPTAGSH